MTSMDNLETPKEEIKEIKKENQTGIEVPKNIIIILGGIAIFLVGFLLGQRFERNRLRHFQGWNDNYQNIFFSARRMDPPPPPEHIRSPLMAIRAHGLIGKILNISGTKLTVQGDDQVEESVITDEKTIVRIDGSPASLEDMKVGQRIAVFGQPNNQGQIAANFIRIFKDNNAPLNQRLIK